MSYTTGLGQNAKYSVDDDYIHVYVVNNSLL